MQRLRVRFARGEEIKFISHLDIMRLWQRAFNRAGLAIAYSEGFNPHPRMSLAVPLALGVTSEAELMDIVLEKTISPHAFTSSVGSQLPEGMSILQAQIVPLTLPALQAMVTHSEYRVTMKNGFMDDVDSRVKALLAKETLPWEHARDTGTRRYDLRVLIDDLWLIETGSENCIIGMRLVCSEAGSGRPEQVTKALGFERFPESIHRSKLILKVK